MENSHASSTQESRNQAKWRKAEEAGFLCCCGSGSAAIGLAVLAIAGTGVLISGLGLGGIVSLKTVSITTICTSPGNPVTLVLSILGLTGHLGMRAVAGTALAFSSVSVISGVALLSLGCCYSNCSKEILKNIEEEAAEAAASATTTSSQNAEPDSNVATL